MTNSANATNRLISEFELGLDSPICLTWELTYACNLACVHCLSSSGRRDPLELSTDECYGVIDEFSAMQVFYVNVGGGEPTIRSDFFDIADYAIGRNIGFKFSTNGSRITPDIARWIADNSYLDVQVSLDGATAEINDEIRGEGSYDTAMTAIERLATAGSSRFKINMVATRENIGQIEQFKAIADTYDAELRVTRLRPSGRGADVWQNLHPTQEQQRQLYEWLLAQGEDVSTADSFFHLGGYGETLPGVNFCGAGRTVCLIDPIGDVYACPFTIHEDFLAGNVRNDGGFAGVWRTSDLFSDLREPATTGACQTCDAYDSCRGGCMAAKFFTGLPLDAPDPECVKGHGLEALANASRSEIPRTSQDHSKPVPVMLTERPIPIDRPCDTNPLSGMERPADDQQHIVVATAPPES